MSALDDPRPLTGEPLALDLVNTVWIDEAGSHDLLDDSDLRSAWLARWGLPNTGGRAQAAHLAEARAAIRGVLERRALPAAWADLDAVLARGRVRVTAAHGTVEEALEAPPAWAPAWRAARDLGRLLAERPDRLKRCANPDCPLWFEDTTRSKTRRWCSMTGGCGSRLKARRHARRTVAAQGDSRSRSPTRLTAPSDEFRH
jgi:predicted RNA-binding Zn ribbon-like protein